jgi:hypothetical protein
VSLKAIVDGLVDQAKDQIDRAYRILGAKPGPGVDLLIYPVQPICGKWIVSGMTPAGRAFVNKFWFAQPIESNHELNKLKGEANDWNLKYKIEYPVLSLEPKGD